CAELAETLLRACPNLKILASSREVLGIAGETSFRVPSLSLPDSQRLPPLTDLTQYEAIQLFIDRARVVNPDFALTEANANAIVQTCQRLDGIPLAIELAAVRVRAMSVEQIAARLDDRFRLLTGGSRTALPRQQTLRALIDWSWDLLSEAERALLHRLSVFWGGWTLEAAEAICDDRRWMHPGEVETSPGQADGSNGGLSHGDASQSSAVGRQFDVLELLTHLVDKSLVMVEEQGEGTRYQLLETIRQYTKDKLFESGEAEQIRARHLEFFLALAEEAEPSLRSGEQLACLNRLEFEHDNLRAALKWARGSGNWDAGLRLAGALARFWYLRGHWREGREWLAKMLSESAANAPSSKAARARALYGAGWLADDQGPEFELYTESLALSRELGQAGRWGEAFSLRGLGASATNRVEPEQAAAFLNESLALFRELNDTWGIALVLFNLGWLASSQEGNTEAQNHWDESLRLFRQTGDRWGIAVTLGALGYLARTQGAYQRAAAMTEEGLSLFRELGDKAGMAISLTRLGNVALRRGDYRQAIVLLEKSLALQQERGDQRGLGALLALLGLVVGYQGDYPLAVAKLEESLALSREVGDEETTGYALSYLGLMTYYQGDFEQATTLWQESLAWHREREDKGGIALALNGLGLVAHSRGDQTQAAALLDESLTLFKEVGDKRYIAIALNGLGRVAHVQGDEAHAAALFKKSLSLRKEMGARRGVAESLEGVAGVTAGQPAKAVRLLAIAQAVRDKIGAPRPPVEHTDYDCTLAALRAQLGEEGFAAVWAEGQAMKLEKAIAQALE
ncbi:MAG: tetratricopeptide repeat protein, partial [Anaerolineales bacterium]